MRILSFYILCLFFIKTNAQEVTVVSVLEKVMSQFKKDYVVDYVSKTYDVGKKKPTYTQRGRTIKLDKSIYANFGNTISVLTPAYSVQVNTHFKEMHVNEDVSSYAIQKQQFDLFKGLELFQEKRYLKESSKTYIIELYVKSDLNVGYQKLVLTIDKATYHINKQQFYTYHFKDPYLRSKELEYSKVEIAYNNYKTEVSEGDKQLFKKEKYYQVITGKVIPMGLYESYKINQGYVFK